MLSVIKAFFFLEFKNYGDSMALFKTNLQKKIK